MQAESVMCKEDYAQEKQMEQYVIRNQKQLRRGITTGTCAAAATKAAAALLLLGVKKESIPVHTPGGMDVTVPVFLTARGDDQAEFMVIKDSGDDPDVTNHAEIYATVQVLSGGQKVSDMSFQDERFPNLYLDGGEGIGRVTKAGLEQEIGQAAINRVPRSMIFQAAGEVCQLAEYEGKLLITISIPAGKELAARTFNPKLGITDGISVLGTTGILEPMSEKAIVDTIETEIRQLSNQGVKNLLVTPGNYGRGYVSDYLHMELGDSVKCSNYIGEMLDMAVAYHMETLLLVGNIGKLIKLAAGIMNTHSRVADGRCEILAVHTVLCGGSSEMAEKIMECINTEEMLALLTEWNLKEAVMQSVCEKIGEHVTGRTGEKLKVGIMLFSEHYGFLGQTKGTEEVLKFYRKEGEQA